MKGDVEGAIKDYEAMKAEITALREENERLSKSYFFQVGLAQQLTKDLAAVQNELDQYRKVVWCLEIHYHQEEYSKGYWSISMKTEEENGLDIAKMQKEMGK